MLSNGSIGTCPVSVVSFSVGNSMDSGARHFRGELLREYHRPRTGEIFQAHDLVTRDWINTFSGTKNNYWRGQVRTGVNATTAASWYREERFSSQYASFVRRDPVDPKYLLTSFTSGPIVWPDTQGGAYLSVDNADTNARISFIGKVRETRTAFQGGTFLGELGEALHGIRHPLKALREGVDSYVRGARKIANRKNSRRRTKSLNSALSDTWLEWVYDKKPLINDIHDFANAIVKAPSKDLIKVSATGRDESVAFQSHGADTSGFDFLAVRWDWRFHRRSSCRYKGAVRMAARTPTTHALQKFGLDWTNFVPTLWELIPYSFLVDYFSNAGKLIDAASCVDWDLAWGCKTVVQQIEAELINFRHDVDYENAAAGEANIVSRDASSTFVARTTQGSRASVNGVDVGFADLQLKIPGVDSLKWLNIAALANSMRAR